MSKATFARIGIACKGLVYFLIAILAAFAAINAGGEKTGTRGALRYLAEQPFGQVFLLLLGIGLSGYVLWRWYQVFYDINKQGKSTIGIFNRLGYFFSGAFYGYLAFYAIKLALAFGYDDHSDRVDEILSSNNGTILTIALGLIFIGKGIFEFWLVFSKIYRVDIQSSKINEEPRTFLYRWGQFGFMTRGVIFGMIGYMTLKTGISARMNGFKTKPEVLEEFQMQFGSWLFFVLAIGMLGYAVFMFVKARYIALYLD